MELTIDPIARIGELGLVPVVEIQDLAVVRPLVRALLAAEMPLVEVTFRTALAADAIRAIRDACPELLVGAGTVLSSAQVDTALAAGASFLVSPGFNPAVVDRALGKRATIVPGVSTPSEIESAMGWGLSVLKFFPAVVAGGTAFLKAVSGVYRAVRFVPTGGIEPTNFAAYLALPNVLACGGSWMVKSSLLEAGDFATIEVLLKEAVRTVVATRSLRAAGRTEEINARA